MKITNLRPKNGAIFDLDDDGIVRYFAPEDAKKGFGAILDQSISFDYDIVQPEYKVGDVVKVSFDLEVKTKKGFVVSDLGKSYTLALTNWGELMCFDKNTLDNYSDNASIVGLWLESGETK